jgi:hypothetical protein
MNGHAHTAHGRSEARRVAPIFQLLGAVLVFSSIVVGVFASHAGAAALSNGTVALNVSSSGAVATNPLVNHQVVDVSVAANSTLSRSSLQSAGFPSGAVPIKVLECSDIGGSPANLPKKPTDCEPETVQAAAGGQANGSMIIKGFTIYALPDPVDLGVSNGTVCDNAAHQCVLGVFSNQNDFSKPHLFSAPFQAVSTASNGAGSTSPSGGSNSSGATSSGSAPSGASAKVSVPPATLANTGGPTLWPWLLGAGFVLLLVGSALRYSRRPAHQDRP